MYQMRRSLFVLIACVVGATCSYRQSIAQDRHEVRSLSLTKEVTDKLSIGGKHAVDTSGERLLISFDSTWEVWDMSKQKRVTTCKETSDCLYVAFTADEKRIVVVTDAYLAVYSSETYKTSHEKIQFNSEFTPRHCALGGTTLAIADADGKTCIYDIMKNSETASIAVLADKEHESSKCVGLSIAENGNLVARGYNVQRKDKSSEERVCVHSLSEKAQVVQITEVPDAGSIWDTAWLLHVRISPDGKLIATSGSRGNIRIWNIDKNLKPIDLDGWIPTTKDQVRSKHIPDHIRTFEFSPDSKDLVSIDRKGNISRHDTSTGTRAQFDKAITSDYSRVFLSGGATDAIYISPKSVKVSKVHRTSK